MPRIKIFVIDHRDGDAQPYGEIIEPRYVEGPSVDPDFNLGPEYTDYNALWEIWHLQEPPDIVGFFGYRKYLLGPLADPTGWTWPAHAPHWLSCSKEHFYEYRRSLVHWDGSELLPLLAQHDIIQAPPFPLDVPWLTDFARSRSREDAHTICDVLIDHCLPETARRIYPYLFITRWSVFDRMMREIEPLRLKLHGKCVGADSNNADYKKRPMAYVMERVYSLWLENSGLSIKELPLLHCWEMQT